MQIAIVAIAMPMLSLFFRLILTLLQDSQIKGPVSAHAATLNAPVLFLIDRN